MSKLLARMSTSLPLPSSPHWQPSTAATWLSDPTRSAPATTLSVSLDGDEAEGAIALAEHSRSFQNFLLGRLHPGPFKKPPLLSVGRGEEEKRRLESGLGLGLRKEEEGNGARPMAAATRKNEEGHPG